MLLTSYLKRSKYHLLLLSFTLLFSRVNAQDFKLMRFDENYSFLRKDSVKNFYSGLKYIPLSASGRSWLSIGGEAREEFDAFNNEDWGKVQAGHDNFLLQRYDLYTDWHLSNTFRFFVQLRSALENGRPNGPRPIDQDQLNVQNLFLDVKAWRSTSDSLIVRAGRQELNYGAGRLISVREGPNVRLYFTGLKFLYKVKDFSLDGSLWRQISSGRVCLTISLINNSISGAYTRH